MSRLFPASKRLMEIADDIKEVKSLCKCGRKASINARIDKDGNVDKDALGEEGGTGELMLKKINNQWLAHQSKEDSQSDEFIDEEFEEVEETDSI